MGLDHPRHLVGGVGPPRRRVGGRPRADPPPPRRGPLVDHPRPPEEYLAAAEGFVACAPKNPAGYGHRGSAHLKLGDRAAARADFRRAIELAPGYAFAGLSLFDLDHEDGDLAAMAALLPSLEE